MSFPASPTNGQTATVNGIQYIYNSVSNSWTRQLTQTGQKTTTSLTQPISPGPGDVWYNPANDTILTYMYDGANWWWVDLDGPAFGTANSLYGNLTTTGNVLAAGFFYSNGAPFVSSNYGNVNMLANLAANSNPITIATSLTVGSNVLYNPADSVTVIGNVLVSGSTTVANINLQGGSNYLVNSANLVPNFNGWSLHFGDVTSTVTANLTIPAPDGSYTAWQLYNSGAQTNPKYGIWANPQVGGTNPGPWTISAWMRAGTTSSAQFFLSGENDDVVFAGGVLTLTNQWQRFAFTGTTPTDPGSRIQFSTNATTGNILIWGPQAEIGYAATAYTPTTGTAIVNQYNNLYAPLGNLAVGNSLQTRLNGNVDINANALVLSAGTTSITSITQTATGNLYTSAPTVTISAPTSQFGGITATANANIGVVYVGNIQSAGNYYTPGQVITMVGNASTFANATFTVTAVGNSQGGTGNVTGLTLTTSGSYAIANTNPATFTVASGSGTGLQVNVYYGVNQPTITNAGAGYVEQPTITFSGGGGAGASAYTTVGSPTSINSTGANLSIVLPQGEVIKVVTSPVILGVTSGNLTSANLGVGQYANTALTATALTGNAIAAGGVGIVGNVYGTSRIGFTWVSNSSSAAYTVFNPATNSVDTYFN